MNSSEVRQTVRSPMDVELIGHGLFTAAFSVLLGVALLVARNGLPTPVLAVLVGPTIFIAAVLTPIAWAGVNVRRQVWVGPLVAGGLIVGSALVALGIAGIVLMLVFALFALGFTLRGATTLPGMPSRIARWIGLLIIAGIFAVLLIHGSKYLNFTADQLLLYGRTDGDMMFHGAIVNAFRYFHFPSTGIDGLRILHYHVGLDALASLIATGTGLTAVLSLVVLRAEILFPAAVFAIGWAATTLGRQLMPKLELSSFSISTASVAMFLIIESGRLSGLTPANDPMLLSGIYLVLLIPAVLVHLIEPDIRIGHATQRHPVWLLALVAIFFLSAMKISTGYVWTGLLGFWILRLLSPKHPSFWLIGAAAAVAFVACYRIFSDASGVGAVFLGTPYYVERGFHRGNYLMPLTQHSHVIAALVLLWLLRRDCAPRPRRLLAESFVFMIVFANLPGLLMQIPGGDAVFFTRAVEWLATPVLAFGIAMLPRYLGAAMPARRKLGWSVVALATLGFVIDAATLTPVRINTAIAGAALLHTGDRSYYVGDNRRTWRLDAKRALKQYGAFGLYRLPPPVPTGANLMDALLDYRTKFGSDGAAYIPPQSDYWAMVPDCDGKSLWPMAVAGIPLIDGYVPVQSACPQEFSLTGYGPPPPARHDISDADLCRRANSDGFHTVLRIEALGDRKQDRTLNCTPAATG
jgi:hypothetical protein